MKSNFNLVPPIYALDKELGQPFPIKSKRAKSSQNLRTNLGHTALTQGTTGGGAAAERSGKGGKGGGGMGGQQAGGVKGGGKRKTHAGSK